MSNTKVPEVENFPKTGRVTEVCQEWMVREDSALAYRLQNQEFDEHLTGNKFRNAVVREDFPKAKDEQIREQRMAEQAAAIYHKMLAEQEEIDNKVAKDLADKMEHEDKLKRRALEQHDQAVARQLLEKERIRVEKMQQIPMTGVPYSPQKPFQLPPKFESQASPHRPNPQNYQANLPRRQALAMPLPQSNTMQYEVYVDPVGTNSKHFADTNNSAEIYNEPYTPVQNLSEQLNQIDIAEIGLPIDEITERQIQEERDAELARKLQEQEGSLEDSLLNRDRLLAIEAQDKELAKLLQERERAKAKRARERAKQKAMAKKQQQLIEHERDTNQIMPDDSYAFPVDVLPNHAANVPRTVASHPELYAIPNPEEDVNYSLPADVLMNAHNFKTNYSPTRNNSYGTEVKEINNIGSLDRETGASVPAIRPSHLELRSPLTRINKPRYPDPDVCESISSGPSTTSPSQLTNIAMAIDPTYTRRGYRASSSYDTASSTVTTSTSSSSPGILPPPDIDEQDDDSPVPPYMPIQGQRRTSSLEKKQKKKTKESGCKQQ